MNSTSQSFSHANEVVVKLQDFLTQKDIRVLLLSVKEQDYIQITFQDRTNSTYPSFSPVLGSKIETITGVKMRSKKTTVRILNEVLHETRGETITFDYEGFLDRLSRDLYTYFLLFGAINFHTAEQIKKDISEHLEATVQHHMFDFFLPLAKISTIFKL